MVRMLACRWGAHREADGIQSGVDPLFDVTYTEHVNAKNSFSGAHLREPGRVFTSNPTVSV